MGTDKWNDQIVATKAEVAPQVIQQKPIIDGELAAAAATAIPDDSDDDDLMMKAAPLVTEPQHYVISSDDEITPTMRRRSSAPATLLDLPTEGGLRRWIYQRMSQW